MSISHTAQVRVRYSETDSMRVVHHRNYAIYFELARTELMRAHGVSYAAMEREGTFLAVQEIGAKYLAPATYDDILTVEARVTGLAAAKVRFDYRVYREEGNGQRLLCEGFTAMASVNAAGRPKRLPPAVRALLATLVTGC
ncbi:MAG: thioesterase family protein [Planctomycetota bacterium]